MLLKGLNSSYNEKEVLDELKSLCITNVEFNKVVRFVTNKSKQDNRILPIFVVQITPQSELSNLRKIKYLFHQQIYWEKLMRRDPIQCKKCQRIGHAASNCNLPYRCVKCDSKHEPGKCPCQPHTLIEKEKLFCVNCNDYGHPASYRGCPKLIENKKRLMNRNLTNNRMVTKKNNTYNTNSTHTGYSYADAAKNSINIQNRTINDRDTEQQTNRLGQNITHNRNMLDNTLDNTVRDVYVNNNMLRLEKLIESNSARINTIASLLERLLNQHERYD